MSRSSKVREMRREAAKVKYRQWRTEYYSTTPTAKSGWKFWKREK